MVNENIASIFRRGSRTYFNSSIFFPEETKQDVFSLYGFVRKADDFIDAIPQQTDRYYAFKDLYYSSSPDEESGDLVIDSFVNLREKRKFRPAWIDSFFDAMEMDVGDIRYRHIQQVLEYIYGSAEVVGLMMASIMQLPRPAFRYARLLGRAMQYINFIRDTKEDLALGRSYYPESELAEFGLEALSEQEARAKPQKFRDFMSFQISRYFAWQEEAERGFVYLPAALLVPVKTASEMYKWTAKKIEQDPYVIFRKKVKPSTARILGIAVMNKISLGLGLGRQG